MKIATPYPYPTYPNYQNYLTNICSEGIIKKTNKAGKDVRDIGKINLKIFESEFGKLRTDEVVLTNEREIHIKNRHPQDYAYFEKFGVETIQNPDVILVDKKHNFTVLLIKHLPETNLNVVLRLAIETDKEDLKNSIMTFHRVRDSFLRKMLIRNKMLYIQE
ncbi:MAG: hypothetical protein FWG36_01680 [Oscillospiraceae bacterium]|nr:hypothetical protein [Oscillospiraceae bacterium]